MRSLVLCLAVVGCANDPSYMECPDNPTDPTCVRVLEAGQDDGTGMGTTVAEAKSSLVLPIKPEKQKDAADRAARTAALGIDVPYVKLGDIEIEVEWTIANLDAQDGIAKVELDGATELFVYDPDMIVLDADEEAPPTPGLDGNIPLDVPANGSITGIFREDQLREASVDIEQVTRANINPFAATLKINKNDTEIQPVTAFDPLNPDVAPTPTGPPIPREAFASIIRVDLVFTPDRHMTLTYNVRVRDIRGDMLPDELLGAPDTDRTAFAPQPYAVMALP